MSDPNLDYLQARARQERNIAISSEDNCVALAHLRMADEYERRAQMLKDAAQPVGPHPSLYDGPALPPSATGFPALRLLANLPNLF